MANWTGWTVLIIPESSPLDHFSCLHSLAANLNSSSPIKNDEILHHVT